MEETEPFYPGNKKKQIKEPLLEKKQSTTLKSSKVSASLVSGEGMISTLEAHQHSEELINENPFLIETWYIDFEFTILGQKIKDITNPTSRRHNLIFDNLFYAELIVKNSENRLFI